MENIAELTAALGIDLDQESFDAVTAAIQAVELQMRAMAVQAQLASTDVSKAMSVVSLESHKEAEGHEHAAHAAHEHGKQLHWVHHALSAVIGLHAAHVLEGWVHHAVSAGAALGDLADKTGLNVREIQELGYAANLHGMSTEYFAGTLNKLSINLERAASKGGEAAQAFNKAGIKIKDVDGKARPAADVLGDIADRLHNLSEEERPAEAMKLLGKAGKDLIPLLKEGSEGLEKFRQEARDLGLVMDKETIESMDKVEKNTKRLQKAYEGLKEHAVASLIPALQDLTENLLAWVKANREDIANALHSAFSIIIKAIKIVAVLLKAAIKVVAFLAKNIGLVAAAVMGLAIAFAAVERAAVAAALKSAKDWITHPIFLLAAAIALAILLLDDLYAWVKGQNSLMGELVGPFEGILDRVGDKIKAVFTDALEWVKKKAKEAWDAITGSVDLDEMTRQAARAGNKAGMVSDEALAKAEKFGFSGQNDARSFDQLKYAVDSKYTPQVNVPASVDGGGAPTQVNAPITQTFNITGDPMTIMKVVAEQQAVLARQLESTLGGAKKK